jgi:hypothetical protein
MRFPVIPRLPHPVQPGASEPAPKPLLTDLHSQFESILDAVWAAEENWRFDDRLDMALKTRRQASR